MSGELSRRELFALGAGTALASSLSASAAAGALPASVVAENDDAVARGMRIQAVDDGHPFHGGIPDEDELYHARHAGRFIQRAVAAYVCDASRYFGDESVIDHLQLALSFLERTQSSDGNIDLLSTNFNSPPDTGFVVHDVASAAKIAGMHSADDIAARFETFLTRAGHGMAKGGIHTPNHRWVVSAALAQINELYPDPKLVKRIDAWLAEGVDIDEEGQFTERSTGGYNATCDEAFVIMAHKLGRPELLDPVRKNLDAMKYMLNPNGEVVTEISNRQDRNTRATMARYWFPLRYMAVTDGNGVYASMLAPHEPAEMHLPLLLEYPDLNEPLPAQEPIPDDYVLDLPRSGITRIRRGKTSATVIHSGNSRWLTVHHGEAVINAVRFASAFFGKGQFRPSDFERRGDALHFSQSLEGRYYQPFNDASQLPVLQDEYGRKRGRRDVSEVCTMDYEGRIRETEDGLEVAISASGTDGVPLTVEINLREGGNIMGATSLGGDRYLLEGGMAAYRMGNDIIQFGPGAATHRYVQVRGAEDKMSGPSVYITAYTPFETTLTIQTSG